MAALFGGSSTIWNSVSAVLFDYNTNMAHQRKEASDINGKNNWISVVTQTPPCAVKSNVATTTPEMSTLFNQSADIKVGYFGIFEFVDIQRSQCETFGDNLINFPPNPTKQNKTMAEKEPSFLPPFPPKPVKCHHQDCQDSQILL